MAETERKKNSGEPKVSVKVYLRTRNSMKAEKRRREALASDGKEVPYAALVDEAWSKHPAKSGPPQAVAKSSAEPAPPPDPYVTKAAEILAGGEQEVFRSVIDAFYGRLKSPRRKHG